MKVKALFRAERLKDGFAKSSRPLLISLAAATLYVLFAVLRFSGEKLFNQFYYVVPIVVPFTMFCLERWEHRKKRSRTQMAIDVVVVTIAAWRVVGHVPFVSGHALFLSYCWLTIESKAGRLAALLVLIETLAFKLLFWNDWLTALCGLCLGAAAALLEQRRRRSESFPQL